jgi:hypothetical protein
MSESKAAENYQVARSYNDELANSQYSNIQLKRDYSILLCQHEALQSRYREMNQCKLNEITQIRNKLKDLSDSVSTELKSMLSIVNLLLEKIIEGRDKQSCHFLLYKMKDKLLSLEESVLPRGEAQVIY